MGGTRAFYLRRLSLNIVTRDIFRHARLKRASKRCRRDRDGNERASSRTQAREVARVVLVLVLK